MQLTERQTLNQTTPVNTVTLDLKRYNELALAEAFLHQRGYVFSQKLGWHNLTPDYTK